MAAIGAVSLLTAFADPEWSVVDAQGFYIGLSISGALGFFASAYSLKLWRPWPTKRRIAVKDLERNELAQELGQKQKPPHWKYETGEWAANRSLATVAQVRAYFNTFCWNVFVLLFGSAVLMSFPGYFVSRYDSAEDIPAIMDELLDWLFIIIDIVDALG